MYPQTETQTDVLIDQLEKVGSIEYRRAPTINELEILAAEGQKKIREYGTQTIKLVDGTVRTIFRSPDSNQLSIIEPDIPSELRGEVQAGVFQHNHPVKQGEETRTGEITLHILPSGGDFKNNRYPTRIAGLKPGGAMNITSQHGVTLNIGITGMDREEDIVRRLKYRVGARETAKETNVWKFYTGPRTGESIINQVPEKVSEKYSLGNGDVIVASHTEYVYFPTMDKAGMSPIATVRYFVFVGWKEFKQLEDNFGGLENLYFGDGVDRLTEKLNLDIPHERNLSDVCKICWKPPKKRGE